jgi:protein-S-isoprenylcysteine O-methyltransferase Ste14
MPLGAATHGAAMALKKPTIHGGALFGIILLVCIAADLIVALCIKSDMLRIPFLRANAQIAAASMSIGVTMLVVGGIAGYVSHEAFNRAAGPNGQVKYILKDGLFKYVRHPFYSSLVVITLSFVLTLRSYLLLVGCAALTALLVLEARKEEVELLALFRDEYLSYQRKTGMFLPRLFKH